VIAQSYLSGFVLLRKPSFLSIGDSGESDQIVNPTKQARRYAPKTIFSLVFQKSPFRARIVCTLCKDFVFKSYGGMILNEETVLKGAKSLDSPFNSTVLKGKRVKF
jgi:hypothetical protein